MGRVPVARRQTRTSGIVLKRRGALAARDHIQGHGVDVRSSRIAQRGDTGDFTWCLQASYPAGFCLGVELAEHLVVTALSEFPRSCSLKFPRSRR